MGATRVRDDVKLAVKAGADVVVIDGMQGGTAATQQVFIEHAGIPTLAAVRQAVEALDDMNVFGDVQLIVSGGIRSGGDVAKALALGADAVAIGQGVLIALGCNSESYFQNEKHIDAVADYAKLGTAPGYCHHCHTGKCPVGITTQDPILEQRLTPAEGARRLRSGTGSGPLVMRVPGKTPGRKSLDQIWLPAYGIFGAMTMNDGRFRFGVPRP
jgi:glutamate synthase domain-containing protein 2